MRDNDALVLMDFRDMLKASLLMPVPSQVKLAFAKAQTPAFVKRLVELGNSPAMAISLLREVATHLHRESNKEPT